MSTPPRTPPATRTSPCCLVSPHRRRLDVRWTGRAHRVAMNVSVLLRLVSTDRTGGRLAGQAELVASGAATVFADLDEAVVFLRRVTASENDTADSVNACPTAGGEHLAPPLT